jgi:hypothetical protein
VARNIDGSVTFANDPRLRIPMILGPREAGLISATLQGQLPPGYPHLRCCPFTLAEHECKGAVAVSRAEARPTKAACFGENLFALLTKAVVLRVLCCFLGSAS